MALASTIVWQVQSGGSDTNGGGYKTGASGSDFSLQTAAQYALTGCTSSGSGSVVLTASAAADMVGNVGYVVSGTNFNTGLMFEVTSVSVGVSITFSTNGASNICTGVGALGAINIGGAKLTLGSLGSATTGAVPGNLICVKADGAYSRTTNTDTIANSGTATSPIRIVGYTTTRPTVSTHGDAYLGRTNGNGALITTNMPAITYTTGRLNLTGAFLILESFNIASAASAASVGLGANSIVTRSLVTNSSTNAAAIGISSSSNMICIVDNDASLTGASGASSAINSSGNGARIVGNRVKGGPAVGMSLAGFFTAAFNTIFASAGNGANQISTSSGGAWMFNTIVGNTGDGLNLITGTTGLQFFFGNMITDNTGDGLDMVSTANAAFVAYHRTRDNSTAINNGGDWITATNLGAVTTDAGGPETDYVNSGSNDYNLIAGSPAVSVALPLYSSMGALQRSQSGGGVCHLAGDGGGFVG